MTVALWMHCDGLIAGRRCLSHASVRSDPGERSVDLDALENALCRGLWPFFPDAGDGEHCEDAVQPDDADPWKRSTTWTMATRDTGTALAFRMLCPLH